MQGVAVQHDKVAEVALLQETERWSKRERARERERGSKRERERE